METVQRTFEGFRAAIGWAPQSVVAAAILIVAIVLALVLHAVLFAIADRILRWRRPALETFLLRTKELSRLALLLIFVGLALPVAPLQPATAAAIGRVIAISFIALVGWTAITVLHVAGNLYLRRFHSDTADVMLARKHVTQVRVLLRVIDTVIILVTIAAALMTFESVRTYGVSLFASAGIAGIVAGLAARPVLSNLFAGIQLAVSQPIRIDDSVSVENEFGTIEEITSTYVVVRLWDLRRMIVPLTYFIERPFQNWTREGSALIGSVMLYVDYTAPIGAIRDKAREIVAASKLWNQKVFTVQVTDMRPNAIEVRILVSADSGGAAFDLRCDLREKIIDFLQRDHPGALPRQRAEQYVAPMGAAGSDKAGAQG